MTKLKVNNNLGGNQIVYLDNETENEKENMQTYNVSKEDVTIDKFVKQVYDQWKGSNERELMLTGIKYFNNETDIDNKIRFDQCGTKGKENKKLSNAKEKKNFMRKLSKQKANYFIGKPFNIECNNEKYSEILEKDYFTKYFHKQSHTLVLESIKEGINWINPYYDEEGKLKFRRVPGNQVKAFWADRDHTVLEQLIHFYDIMVYKGDTSNICTYADYYSKKGVVHYVMDDKGFKRVDETKKDPEGNFIINKTKMKKDKDGIDTNEPELDENGNLIIEAQEMVWDILPWVALKYNSDELSLIKFIKDKQDNYEKIISTAIDLFNDMPEVIKIIKGYSGENLTKLIEDIIENRAVIVDEGGDVSSLETPIQVEAFKTLLEIIRKDAYEDGSGVDTQNTETGEKSGVALSFLYSDLDTDSDELEKEFDVFIEWLLHFIDFDILMKTGQDYYEEEVTVVYHKSMIVNEKEQIENINKSGTVKLPTKLLLAKHPLVDDVSETEKMMEEQEKEEMKEMEAEMQKFGNVSFTNSNINSNKTLTGTNVNNDQAATITNNQ